jgi:hypothetical protein
LPFAFRRHQKNADDWPDQYPQHADFTVVEVMKGDPKTVAELRAGYGGGDCGIPLIAGFDYLVLVGKSGEMSYCQGFFGPHYGWNETRQFEPERLKVLRLFTQSIRDHFRSKTKIIRPPPDDFGLEDSGSRWFEPLERKKSENAKKVEPGCKSDSASPRPQ